MAGMGVGIAQAVAHSKGFEFARRNGRICWISAGYEAMAARGRAAAHAMIFKRGENLIAIAPRLVIGLHDDWGDTLLGNAARAYGEMNLHGGTASQGKRRRCRLCWANFPWRCLREEKA